MKKSSILVIIIGIVLMAVASQFGQEIGDLLGNKIVENANEFEYDPSKPWFTNSFYKISIDTPYELKPQNVKIPAGYEDIITLMKSYNSNESGIMISVLYMESKFDTYDVEVGLRGTISNILNVLKAEDVVFTFTPVDNELDDIIGDGTFSLTNGNSAGIFKGYCYWNGNGDVMITSVICEKNPMSKEIIDKVIGSIRILF